MPHKQAETNKSSSCARLVQLACFANEVASGQRGCKPARPPSWILLQSSGVQGRMTYRTKFRDGPMKGLLSESGDMHKLAADGSAVVFGQVQLQPFTSLNLE